MDIIFLPFYHNHGFDGRADGRTDRILIARPRLHSMQTNNNESTACRTLHVSATKFDNVCLTVPRCRGSIMITTVIYIQS